MSRLKSLITLLVISSAIAVALPLFDIVYLYPSLTRLIMEKATADTEKLTALLSSDLERESFGARGVQNPDSQKRLQVLVNELGLMRASLRSPEGVVLMSTDQEQIGQKKDLGPLRRIFSRGEGFSRMYSVALPDGQKVRMASLVESLAPIQGDSGVYGVLELIQDISATRGKLDRAVSRASGYLLVAPLVFLTVIVVVSQRARKALVQQEAAELELSKHREELALKHYELSTLFAQVEEAKGEWQMTLDCIEEMVVLVDKDGLVRRCNAAFSRFVGHPYLGVLGKHWQKLLFTEGVEVVSLNQQRFEVYHRENDRWLVLNFYPHKDGNNSTRQTVITIRQQSRDNGVIPSGEGQ